ncbi:MAG TPA: squalene/phytoene synthase family protein [Gammaproteobacteria bacterium]|nr:squalene/phytoene synthase family protein [Gammaproteobacteria bacterium]
MLHAKKYCYEKVAQPTFPLYYSLRKLTPVERDQIVAVHAFYREIEEIIFECQDYELGLTKLKWWRSEIAQLGLERLDHPVMIVLQETGEFLPRVQQRLLNIVEGFRENTVPKLFVSFEDIVVHWMRTAGERELLINEILQSEEIVNSEIIYQCMLVIEMVNYIQQLRKYLRRDIIYFSADELQKFGVTQNMLREFVTTPEIKKLLQYQVEKIERAYAVTKTLSRTQRRKLSHLMVRCEIARAILHEIQKSDFCVLENWIGLTPLRYAWIAFS